MANPTPDGAPPEGHRIHLDILAQPDDTTCGPTCLQAVYRFLGAPMPLARVIREVPSLEAGGTLGVNLARHALAQGFKTRLYTFNLRVFDPSWFDLSHPELLARLDALVAVHTGSPKLLDTIHAYRDYIALGGAIEFCDLTPALLRHHLEQGRPILTGLSATWLYRSPRERTDLSTLRMVDDDLRGEPQGHFVVLCGYDPERGTVDVADPLHRNPLAQSAHYEVSMDRLVSAIHLGVLTYDGNLLVIERPDANG